jgi:hypothetical protein
MRRVTYYLEGRYTVTVACADDLTAAERAGMEEWLKKQVGFLQRVDGPPLFTEAEERAFAERLKAIDRRPRKLPEVIISAAFRERFPDSSEIGRERHGEHEMHIYFDNGPQVACWSVYWDGDQEGEILGDADAAAVRRSCRSEEPTHA